MAKGKDKKEALATLQTLTDNHRSVNVRATKTGYEITIFRNEGIDHSHYEDATLVGAIMKANKAEEKKTK